MITIDVIRHSDGRTFYRNGSSPIAPTNPRTGPPTLSNTVIWSGKTRVTSVIIPRQNPVNLDTWESQSRLRTYSGPVTYERPAARQSSTSSTVVRQSIAATCSPTAAALGSNKVRIC